MAETQVARLLAALGQLRDFLRRAKMRTWEAELEALERRLVARETQTDAMRDLEQHFGGMGSLNDISVCRENQNIPEGQSPEAANEEVERLLDAVFRELRLVGASPMSRLTWRWYEWRYRHDLAPACGRR